MSAGVGFLFSEVLTELELNSPVKNCVCSGCFPVFGSTEPHVINTVVYVGQWLSVIHMVDLLCLHFFLFCLNVDTTHKFASPSLKSSSLFLILSAVKAPPPPRSTYV